jgi:hypothetical protein
MLLEQEVYERSSIDVPYEVVQNGTNDDLELGHLDYCSSRGAESIESDSLMWASYR